MRCMIYLVLSIIIWPESLSPLIHPHRQVVILDYYVSFHALQIRIRHVEDGDGDGEAHSDVYQNTPGSCVVMLSCCMEKFGSN